MQKRHHKHGKAWVNIEIKSLYANDKMEYTTKCMQIQSEIYMSMTNISIETVRWASEARDPGKNRVRNSKSKRDRTPDGKKWGMRMVSATVIWFIVQKCKRNAEHFEAKQIKRVCACVCWSVSVEKHGKNDSEIASKTIKLADSRDELNQCTCLLHVMGAVYTQLIFPSIMKDCKLKLKFIARIKCRWYFSHAMKICWKLISLIWTERLCCGNA